MTDIEAGKQVDENEIQEVVDLDAAVAMAEQSLETSTKTAVTSTIEVQKSEQVDDMDQLVAMAEESLLQTDNLATEPPSAVDTRQNSETPILSLDEAVSLAEKTMDTPEITLDGLPDNNLDMLQHDIVIDVPEEKDDEDSGLQIWGALNAPTDSISSWRTQDDNSGGTLDGLLSSFNFGGKNDKAEPVMGVFEAEEKVEEEEENEKDEKVGWMNGLVADLDSLVGNITSSNKEQTDSQIADIDAIVDSLDEEKKEETGTLESILSGFNIFVPMTTEKTEDGEKEPESGGTLNGLLASFNLGGNQDTTEDQAADDEHTSDRFIRRIHEVETRLQAL